MQFTPNWRQIPGQTPAPNATPKPQAWMDVVIVSANVLALDPTTDNPQGRMAATRTLRLDAQWSSAKIAVAGVQEARTSAGRQTSQNYVIFSSGADLNGSPSLGCELWFHKDLPFWTDANGQVFAWPQCQPVVVHSDPRRLLIVLTWPGLRLCFSVLHAPYIGGSHTAESVHQWWRDTADLFASHSQVPHISCTDANAPLGQETSELVGPHGAEDSRPATQPFTSSNGGCRLLLPGELDKWADALRPMIASLVRGSLQGLAPYLFSVDELAGLANLLPPQQALHLARLRYFKRFLKVCPSALWTMLVQDESDHGWLALCRQSFTWLCQHYDYPLPVQADASILDWLQFVQLDASWHGRLRTAAAACRHFFRAKAEHHCQVAQFEREFVQMGAQLPAADTTIQTLPWECGLCGVRFATSRGLAIHAHKKHGYRDKVRYYALGAQCLACNLEFHTRPRLCRHLQVQAGCLATYQACFAPASEEMVDDLDGQDRELHRVLRQQGWTEFHALQACLCLPGPVLPAAGTPEAAYMLQCSRQRMDNQQPAFTQMFGLCTSSSPVPSSQLWGEEAALPAFVFQSAGGVQKGDGRLDMGGLAREYAILHIRCLVFVHFFSGYRRHGDLHTILDQQSLESGVQLFTLSVDLCMQRESGDLARPAAYKWWRSRALAGQLMGCGGGPPCETYTAARWNDEQGPRPLRDRACPWGRFALSNREWKQLAIGSQLMHFMLMMTLVMIQTGGCCFVEHPQWPLWLELPKVASIWGSRQMRLLRTVASVAVTSFDQCVFQANAKKPTTILTVRLQRFRCCALTTGWGGRCSHAAGYHRALKGRTATGAFRTAEHKVYPEALNRALGNAIHHFAQTLAAEGDHERVLPTAFEPFVAQIFATMEHVQPDYHGSA
eukprot:Skav210826  [mRNA]  locus=scaffold1597:393139:398030:- [translate_table: standard]